MIKSPIERACEDAVKRMMEPVPLDRCVASIKMPPKAKGTRKQ